MRQHKSAKERMNQSTAQVVLFQPVKTREHSTMRIGKTAKKRAKEAAKRG